MIILEELQIGNRLFRVVEASSGDVCLEVSQPNGYWKLITRQYYFGKESKENLLDKLYRKMDSEWFRRHLVEYIFNHDY